MAWLPTPVEKRLWFFLLLPPNYHKQNTAYSSTTKPSSVREDPHQASLWSVLSTDNGAPPLVLVGVLLIMFTFWNYVGLITNKKSLPKLKKKKRKKFHCYQSVTMQIIVKSTLPSERNKSFNFCSFNIRAKK